MKKALLGVIVLAFAIFAMAQTSEAIIIGYPDLSAEGTFTYSGGLFSASLTPQTIDFGDGVLNPFDVGTGSFTFSASYKSSTFDGSTVQGNFGQDTSVDPSFDYYATLGGEEYYLRGHISSFVITGYVPPDPRKNYLGSGEALVILDDVSANLFDKFQGYGGMVTLLFNLNVPFSEFMFDSDFHGKVKADVGPVPEPGTMMLLGSGLVGLAGWGRKKFRK